VSTIAVSDRVRRRAPVAPPRLAIRALGSFTVDRDGEPIPAGAWQSKKARDLVKLLVCRRGHPATRDALIEALWPEQDPARTGNRLSVALSTARTVLDPHHRVSSNHYIRADRSTMRLDHDHLELDVEGFLATARAGLDLHRSGEGTVATGALQRAEAAYTGEFLEEDPYEDWAAPLREEARAAYVAVAGALARLAGGLGDHQTAIRLRLRILERDPYDEDAHLALVGSLAVAGHHGRASSAYDRYACRMREIGVEPAPFPAVDPAPPQAPRSP
jgi:DNA-binding SARP family transcriptional activator